MTSNNTAYAYLYKDEFVSIYVNLPEHEQIIFYWCLVTDQQKRLPKWRVTKQTIEEGMEIVSYNTLGCVVNLNGRRAVFHWHEYGNKDNNPAHKGKLVNFGDWEVKYDPDYNHNSPSSAGEYTGITSGHYSQPQPYEED